MKRYFYLEDSPYLETYQTIRLQHDNFPFPNGIIGSYNLLPARLLNLSYADYLRFCRDVLGANIVEKGTKYPVAYFRSTPEVQQFLKLLNKRAELAVKLHDNPCEIVKTLEGDYEKVPLNIPEE